MNVDAFSERTDAEILEAFRRNVRGCWRRADKANRIDARSWYPDAHELCLSLDNARGLSIETVAGVVAAISPGLRWESNVDYSRALIGWHQGTLEDGSLRPSIHPDL